MPAIPVLDAVSDALAWHYMTEVPDLKAFRGWPERDQDLDLDADEYGEDYRAVLSVVASPRYTLERINPTPIESVLDEETGELLTLYRIGYIEGNVQIDLWTDYRARRDEFGLLVLEASANMLPHTSDLRLTASGFFDRAGYYDREFRADVRDIGTPDDGNSVSVGEWRRTYTATVSTDLVLQARHRPFGSFEIEITAQRGAGSVTETLTIPS